MAQASQERLEELAQSMSTTSGRKSPTADMARLPSPTTSTIWIWVCAINRDRTCDAT